MPPAWSTTEAPALYAPNARPRLPLYLSMSCLRYLAPASIFSLGSKGSRTERSLDVPGMSCISPLAPFADTAHGRYADSRSITARRRLAWSFCAPAALSIKGETVSAGSGSHGASTPDAADTVVASVICLRMDSRCDSTDTRCRSIEAWVCAIAVPHKSSQSSRTESLSDGTFPDFRGCDTEEPAVRMNSYVRGCGLGFVASRPAVRATRGNSESCPGRADGSGETHRPQPAG